MAMKGRPNLPLMGLAILLVCGALGLHIACMCLPDYAVMDDYKAMIRDVVEVMGQKDDEALKGVDDQTFVWFNKLTFNFGLWQFCTKLTDQEGCIDFMDDPLFAKSKDISLLSFQRPGWLYTCQLVSIAGAVLLGLTLFEVIAILIKPKSKFGEPYGACALAVVAGITVLAANLIFMSERDVEFVMESNIMFDNNRDVEVKEEYKNQVLQIFNDHFRNGTMLLVNMATPFLAILCGVAFVIIAILDKRWWQRERDGMQREEGMNLKSSHA